MDSNESYSEYSEGGNWKKWLIIGGIVLVVVGLGVGTFLILRSRSGGQPPIIAPVNEAVTSGEQPPSALSFQTSADKATVVPLAVPSDPSGQPILGAAQQVTGANKTALGAPADSQVSMTITKPAGGDTMVAEITITKPAAPSAGTAPATNTNAAAPATNTNAAAPATQSVTVPVALPTDNSGKVVLNAPKALSIAEKQDLGLPPSAEATVTVKTGAGGQGLVTEISVGPVTQPAAPAGSASGQQPVMYMGVQLNVENEMTAEQKAALGIPANKSVKYKYVAPDPSSGMVAPVMLLLDESVLPPPPVLTAPPK